MELDEDQIAEICHEANRMYCRFIKDEVAPTWEELDRDGRATTIKGVRLVLNTPPGQMPNPMAMHDFWMKEKLQDGWRYGERIDREKKVHPCLMPWEFLSADQRLKDNLFLGIAFTLIHPRLESRAKAEAAAQRARVIQGGR